MYYNNYHLASYFWYITVLITTNISQLERSLQWSLLVRASEFYCTAFYAKSPVVPSSPLVSRVSRPRRPAVRSPCWSTRPPCGRRPRTPPTVRRATPPGPSPRPRRLRPRPRPRPSGAPTGPGAGPCPGAGPTGRARRTRRQPAPCGRPSRGRSAPRQDLHRQKKKKNIKKKPGL